MRYTSRDVLEWLVNEDGRTLHYSMKLTEKSLVKVGIYRRSIPVNENVGDKELDYFIKVWEDIT